MDRLTHLLLEDVCHYKGCLCPGGDAGSGLEAGCPKYGIFHSPGVAQRHGLTAVRQLSTLCLSFFFVVVVSRLLCFFFSSVECPQCSVEQALKSRVCLSHFSVLVRCDSTERLRNSLDYLRSVLNDSTSFKLIYRYAFDFARVSPAQSFLQRCSVLLKRLM